MEPQGSQELATKTLSPASQASDIIHEGGKQGGLDGCSEGKGTTP
jgi:hypothetical protein